MKDGVGFGSFDRVCRTLKDYLTCLNRSLGLLPSASPPGRIQSSAQVLQGKVARHSALLSSGIGMLFRVIGAFAHASFKSHGAPPGTETTVDGPLKQAEDLTKAILAGPALQSSIKDLMSQIAISPEGDQVMQYLPRP